MNQRLTIFLLSEKILHELLHVLLNKTTIDIIEDWH